MAENEKEEKGQQPPPKPSKLPWIMLLVVVVAGGGGMFYFMNQQKHAAHEAKKKMPEIGPLLAVDPIVVNLDDQNVNRYLKVTLSIELEEALDEEGNKLLPRVRDKLIIYFSSLKAEQVQKTDAKLEIKKQIIKTANEVFGRKMAKDVYFSELVMQ